MARFGLFLHGLNSSTLIFFRQFSAFGPKTKTLNFKSYIFWAWLYLNFSQYTFLSETNIYKIFVLHLYARGKPSEKNPSLFWTAPLPLHFGHTCGNFNWHILDNHQVTLVKAQNSNIYPKFRQQVPQNFWNMI